MIGPAQFLREVAAGIAAANEGRISAPFAKEQHVGIDDEHRGQHQRGGEHGFHFKSSTSNA
jgi:hypothetical protein